MAMTIKNLQDHIEESLANLPEVSIPIELEGLRNLPVSAFRPRVTIYYKTMGGRKNRRKLRETADASYFDPEICELVIGFEPVLDLESQGQTPESLPGSPAEPWSQPPAASDVESAMDQFIDALKEAESTRPFVGLKWFRDHFLPGDPNRAWARVWETNSRVMSRAIADSLVQTTKVPNPNSPLHPTTAIRLNRAHPRFDGQHESSRSTFSPIRIRGGMASDTVIGDRADRS